ncbi:hypothetical protein [Polycladidibacter hongkongensis]|uniref:hypothetical protein n=1 Tax=Polycladidibacter hongkongensis TaxID=1647556 RepID=UPI000833D55D|nr:hypothetical protein [Pseudovibrio hongkongensis]
MVASATESANSAGDAASPASGEQPEIARNPPREELEDVWRIALHSVLAHFNKLSSDFGSEGQHTSGELYRFRKSDFVSECSNNNLTLKPFRGKPSQIDAKHLPALLDFGQDGPALLLEKSRQHELKVVLLGAGGGVLFLSPQQVDRRNTNTVYLIQTADLPRSDAAPPTFKTKNKQSTSRWHTIALSTTEIIAPATALVILLYVNNSSLSISNQQALLLITGVITLDLYGRVILAYFSQVLFSERASQIHTSKVSAFFHNGHVPDGTTTEVPCISLWPLLARFILACSALLLLPDIQLATAAVLLFVINTAVFTLRPKRAAILHENIETNLFTTANRKALRALGLLETQWQKIYPQMRRDEKQFTALDAFLFALSRSLFLSAILFILWIAVSASNNTAPLDVAGLLIAFVLLRMTEPIVFLSSKRKINEVKSVYEAKKIRHGSFQLSLAKNGERFNSFLSVSAGEKVAALGGSIAIRGELIETIAGLKISNRWQCRIEGTKTQRIDPIELAQNICYIDWQLPFLPISLRENLTPSGAMLDDSTIIEGLEQCGALDIFDSAGFSLDMNAAEIAEKIPRGACHHLHLARVFLNHPPLVILEDPTAQMDAAQEEHFINALEEHLLASQTLVFSTSRAAPLRLAKRLVSLQGYKILTDTRNDYHKALEST